MFNIAHYSSFLLAILIFQAVPGAGTITILSATAKHGKPSGMASVLGTITGDAIFMIAAVAGLAGIMQANPLLFTALQWVGAAYLCWMGICLLKNPPQTITSKATPEHAAWKYFAQAFTVSLTNPKTILFFISFFPLFLQKDSTPATLLIMMAHVSAISLFYQTLLVLLGHKITTHLKKQTCIQQAIKKLAGLAFIGFGLKLAASNR